MRGSSTVRFLPGVMLEENLQGQLKPPRDVALTMGQAKIGVAIIRQPKLVHGAEEVPIENVAAIGLEPNIAVLTEVGVLIHRDVFIAIPETADVLVQSGRVAKLKSSGINPS